MQHAIQMALNAGGNALAIGGIRRQRIDTLAHGLHDQLDALVQHFAKNLVLGVEVVVNAARLDAGGIGHLA